NPGPAVLATNYKPSAADIANGSVVLTLTSGGNNCTPVAANMTLTITPAPTISVGNDVTVCSINPTTTLTAVTTAPGVQWSEGFGTYNASVNVNPMTYTLHPNEVINGIAGLIVRTNGGSCPPVRDTIFIFVEQAPTVNAGPALNTCANSPIVAITGA